ncbi:MAG: aminoacyl-tRNA hydrolase [Planctomycetes bacterium]|nr:aminoacyl-tRNA hydrolase [Planctomycetota bacterium]
MKLVVGIGNPGAEYESTRHNVGFDVVRLVAHRRRAELEAEKSPTLGRRFGRLARIRDKDGEVKACLSEPWTYVNETGQLVRSLVDRWGVQPSEVLVVVDDLNLELGNLRLRADGSSGGHNGLKSIERHLGTQGYPRLRIGIGAPKRDTVDHVLSRFSKQEREEIAIALEHAADLVERWIDGAPLAELMNRSNRKNNEL